jgi:uncharacterized membrane protein
MDRDWILTLIYAGNGLLFIALSIPLVLRKVGPNHLYGFRFPKTLADEKTWYAVNRTGGIDLCIAGVFITITALLLKLFLPDSSTEIYALINTAILVIAVTCVLVHSLIVLKRY